METSPETNTLDPERQLEALRTFIDSTTYAMTEQFQYLDTMRHYPGLFGADKIASLEYALEENREANTQSLNNFFEASTLSLQIVHNSLDRPVNVNHFLGFHPKLHAYGVRVFHPEEGPAIWKLESSADIQLAPYPTETFTPYGP